MPRDVKPHSPLGSAPKPKPARSAAVLPSWSAWWPGPLRAPDRPEYRPAGAARGLAGLSLRARGRPGRAPLGLFRPGLAARPPLEKRGQPCGRCAGIPAAAARAGHACPRLPRPPPASRLRGRLRFGAAPLRCAVRSASPPPPAVVGANFLSLFVPAGPGAGVFGGGPCPALAPSAPQRDPPCPCTPRTAPVQYPRSDGSPGRNAALRCGPFHAPPYKPRPSKRTPEIGLPAIQERCYTFTRPATDLHPLMSYVWHKMPDRRPRLLKMMSVACRLVP
jgi:hypothetical protein